MELTRRDAVRALAASGVVSASALALSEGAAEGAPRAGEQLTETDVATMEAVAEVVYPSAIEDESEFVAAYVRSLDGRREARVTETVARLNERTRILVGAPFHEIADISRRDAVLRSMGVDKVQSLPDGSLAARVRYHLVNSLLYHLFTTPTGSELFGIRNPTGYPGGFATYRQQVESSE